MPAKPVFPTAAARDDLPATEVEVLPPEKHHPGGQPGGRFNDAVPRLIALLLDNLIKVPGTQRRVGLNPFLDLLPGIGEAGDAAATAVSSLLILEGARRGLPKIVLVRMAGNILLNGLVGTIPGAGSVFAFWFRATQRNFNLLQLHTRDNVGARSTRADWFFVIALLTGVLLLAGLFIGIGFYVSYRLLKALF